jgi:hypothetical protein
MMVKRLRLSRPISSQKQQSRGANIDWGLEIFLMDIVLYLLWKYGSMGLGLMLPALKVHHSLRDVLASWVSLGKQSQYTGVQWTLCNTNLCWNEWWWLYKVTPVLPLPCFRFSPSSLSERLLFLTVLISVIIVLFFARPCRPFYN